MDIPNCQYWPHAHAAAALSRLDRREEARRTVEPLLAQQPVFTRDFAERKPFFLKRPEQPSLYLEGPAKAGRAS